MRLSEIVRFADVRVIRDGAFENLGFLTETQPCSLVFLESGRFAAALRRNKGVSAVLSAPAVAELVPEHMALAVCPEPRVAFALIHNSLAQSGFYWEGFETAIDPTAEVHPMASVAERNVRIGPGCSIGPHVTIGERDWMLEPTDKVLAIGVGPAFRRGADKNVVLVGISMKQREIRSQEGIEEQPTFFLAQIIECQRDRFGDIARDGASLKRPRGRAQEIRR